MLRSYLTFYLIICALQLCGQDRNDILDQLKEMEQTAQKMMMSDLKGAVALLEEKSQLAKKHNFLKEYYSTRTHLADIYVVWMNHEKAYEYGIEAYHSGLLDKGTQFTALHAACHAAGTINKSTADSLYAFANANLVDFFPEHLSAIDSNYMGTFYRTYAAYKRMQGENVGALELFQKAHSIFPRGYNFSQARLVNIFEMILLFQAIGDNENASVYIQEGQAMADQQRMEVSRGKSYSVLARFYWEQGEKEKAREVALKAIDFLKDSDYEKQLTFAYQVMIKWGFENDLSLSRYYYNLCKPIIPNLPNDNLEMGMRLIGAEVLIKEARFGEAKKILLQILKDDFIESRPNLARKANRLMAEAEYGLGNTASAYSYQEAHHKIKDSIFLTTQNQFVLDANARYKKREQDLAITKLQLTNSENEKEILKKNRTMMAGGAGLIILGIFGALIFNLYRTKQKSARELEEKNKIISESLSEKELLLKEIHHRVKNNLQVISSLLSLQTEYIKDDSALSAIQEGRDRVKSMAIIHQNLYQEDNLTGIEVRQYFEKLTRSLFNSYNIRPGQIKLALKIDEINLDVDTVIPLGLVVNELITNALKYAFPNQREGNIIIELIEKEDRLILKVIDDGVGFDGKSIDEESQSFGYQIIQAFKDKLDADLNIDGSEGTKVIFAMRDYKRVG